MIQDCSAAVENILLTAVELGIGSCWCGLFPMVTPVKKVRELLKLEEYIIPMALIHLGYPNEKSKPEPNMMLKEFMYMINNRTILSLVFRIMSEIRSQTSFSTSHNVYDVYY